MTQVVWIVSASGASAAKAAGCEIFLSEEEASAKAEALTKKLRTVDCSPQYTAHRMIIREFPEEEEPDTFREQIKTFLAPKYQELCQERQRLVLRKRELGQEFCIEDRLHLQYLEFLLNLIDDAVMGKQMDTTLYLLHLKGKIAEDLKDVTDALT